MSIRLLRGDCLERMKDIEPGSVDLVLADPPYGTTACKWDSIIDLEKMWRIIDLITTDQTTTILTSIQPFTTKLIYSNINNLKYTLVWKKSKIQHFAQAPYRFLTEHEDIVVFSRAGTSKNAKLKMVYNPQGTKACYKVCKGKGHSDHRPSQKKQNDYLQTTTNYPKSIIDIKSSDSTLHPTQKPLALMEYLIKTYTTKGDTVLDFCMGSGTTGVACKNLKRNFIGIELDKDYYRLAKERIKAA